MKKITAFLLAVLMCISTFSLSTQALSDTFYQAVEAIEVYLKKQLSSYDKAEISYAKSTGDFLNMATKLTAETFEDSFFSKIIVDVKNNTVFTDGEKVSVSANDILVGTEAEPTVSLYAILKAHISGSFISGEYDSFDDYIESLKDKYFGLETAGEYGYEITVDETGRYHITKPYQTKRLIVRTKDALPLYETYGASTVISDGEGKYILQFSSEKGANKAFECYKKDSSISSVSVDKVVSSAAIKGSYIDHYNLDRYGAERIESDRFISYLKKNNKTAQIKVAVIDTGIDSGHEMFDGRIVSGGYDFFNNDKYTVDDNSHGTHVSGIIVDNTPSTVKILPIKCFGSGGDGTDLMVSLGIERAIQQKADVINMSFGSVCADENCEVNIAVNKAIKSGIVCVAAAGNEYSDTKNCCPAGNVDCITVSAVDSDDRFADFSNFGSAVDVAAPGVDIYSSVPRLLGQYEAFSGTSMAAPFVSAAVAMLLTKSPSMTVSQTKAQLKKATVDLGLKGDDPCFGFGVIDFGVYLGDKKTASKINIEKTGVTAYVGKNIKLPTEQIDATVTPFDATDKSYTVSFSDKSIAKYDGFGVTALKAGTTTMKFTLANKKSDSCKVTAKKSVFWIDYASSSYAGGKGTQNSPYLISSAAQLSKLSLDASKGKLSQNTYFRLTKNIDLKGKNWYPINGTSKNGDVLRINLDGGGYSISNLTINDFKTGIYVLGGGLFYSTTGEIKNLDLKNVNINLPRATYAGAFSAVFGGYMKNCYASGKVTAMTAGGLVGEMSLWGGLAYSVGIANCRSDITVKGMEMGGGIAGVFLCGRINNCIFAGRTIKESLIEITGGIAALVSSVNALLSDDIYAEVAQIVNCVSVSNIAGYKVTNESGGNTYKPTISNCYYSGSDSAVEMDLHSKSTSAKKVSSSNFKSKSFYTKSSNWNSNYPWQAKIWKTDSKALTLQSRKYEKKTSEFDYVDLGKEIVVTGYGGSSTSITIPSKIDSKPVSYVDTQFQSKNAKLKSITFGSNVKILAYQAFTKDNLPSLKKVKLGSNLEAIAAEAFKDVKIGYITIPEKTTHIAASAFTDCSNLKYVFFSSRTSSNWSENAFIFTKSKGSVKVYYPSGKLGWTRFKFNNAEQIKHDMSKAAAIYVDPDITLKVGKSTNLSAVVLPESAKATITYKSYNTSVATVNSKGVVTPKKTGKVTLTLKSSDGKATLSKVYTISAYEPYTVTFNANGGTGESYTQKIQYKTETALTANKFTRKGYTFAGWSMSKDGKVAYKNKQKVLKIAKPGAKITLYAKWVKK